MTGVLEARRRPARGEAVPAAAVLVTTYRRVARLAACLEGLRAQTRAPDEVVVVVHASDDASIAHVEGLTGAWAALRCVQLHAHGSLAALNHGLAAARSELVAMIDDDAVPDVEWLERIVHTFEGDERIAGVGGKDIVFVDGQVVGAPAQRLPAWRGDRPREVGRIQWFGRMIGNHHLGTGAARDVDVLKGANMSLRRSAVARLGYDERLQGTGAVVHTEMSICLPLRRRGFRIVYDPAIVVHHYPSPRPHGDRRLNGGADTVLAAAHNEALQLLDYFGPGRRVVFSAWAFAIGATDAPGVVVLLRDALTGRPAAWRRFVAAQRGRANAWRTWRVPRNLPAPLAGEGTEGALATVPRPGGAIGDPGLAIGDPGLAIGDPGLAIGDPGLAIGDPGRDIARARVARRRRFGDHIAVLTDGRQDPGLATLINSLVRSGFDGTLWVGRRGSVSAFLNDLPPEVRERIDVRVLELETERPLTYFKPDFLERVWELVEPEATSVIYMDCDLVVGCEWEFVHAWVGTGLAIVEDIPGRDVGAEHPIRRGWQAFMADAGIPPVRDVGAYYNAGFVGVPAGSREILAPWKALGQALEGLAGVRDTNRPVHTVAGALGSGSREVGSADVRALMRPFFLEDQDAFNMALMASAVPISAMGPNAMGLTGDRTAILPHAVGPDKPWLKGYVRMMVVRGLRPTFADDAWWAYSGHPIPVARGWRYGVRRWSWRAAKALARIL